MAKKIQTIIEAMFAGVEAKVFVIDTDGSKITKMRAYEPYGPGGSVGFGLEIGHRIYRMSHRRSR